MIKRHWPVLVLILLCVGAGLWALWVNHVTREEPYSLIEDRLYVGQRVSQPPPGTTVVVNLCDARDPYAVKVSHWKPILDAGEPPSLEWLSDMITFLDNQDKQGETIYIHCAAGVSRSAFVATAFLMHRHNWNRDKALKFLKSQRPQMNPRPAFLKLLGEWEKRENR